MAIFVFVTEECERSAARHGYHDELAKFRERIELAQDVRQFDPFPPPYLVKKKFATKQGRLIAALHPNVGEHAVVVFLTVMIRGEAAYENHFSRNPIEYGEKHLNHLVSAEALVEYVSARTASEPPPEKPKPTAAEYGYLHEVFSHQGGESLGEMICESAEWVSAVGSPHFKNRFETLQDTLLEIRADDAVGGTLTRSSKSKVGVLSRHFPGHNIRLLVAPTEGEAVDREKLSKATRDVLDSENPSHEMILQASRRAYPSLVLADLDLWSETERDVHANLALSPEESQLLQAARRAEGGFPLFINGRAGSGKTTLLQYLFSEFLFYHLNAVERAATPVYLTCNAELLAGSRQVVEKLLRCSANFLENSERAQLIAQNEGVLGEAFKEFHAFLYDLLEPSEIADRFAPTKYVNYARFKQLWVERFAREPSAAREYGPDVSWHVIRSYIKGLSADVDLSPEEYQQLDNKQITITQKTYEAVYNKVWTRWYQPFCEGHKYWDDQDLARHLLENDRIKPQFTAVFCDEAQDFTRVELEILLRSSVFSHRKLEANEIAKVPFVFAGDQFQTLNPTGFRWDAIRASFVEKFIMALDPMKRSRLSDLNYQELTLNYRSSGHIVRFSNFIQALRARLFSLPGLKPQVPWDRETAGAVVVGVKKENAEFWEAIKKDRSIAVIVPCGEGEELDFIRQDGILSQKIKVEDKIPDALVLSSSRAKGLEFNRVVVYGFGDSEHARGKLLGPLRGKGEFSDDPDVSLPLQYFINRLYVAVSRPKKRLFVVDSEKAFRTEGFWEFASDDQLEQAILNGIRNGESVWRAALSRLEFGLKIDLNTEAPENPKVHAEALVRQGRANADPYMLRQAAASFRNLNEIQLADICKAEALALEGEHLESGRTFLRCEKYDEAVREFWCEGREGGWKAIVDAAETKPAIAASIEARFAGAIVRGANSAQILSAFSSLAAVASTTDGAGKIASRQGWTLAVSSVLDQLSKTKLAQDDAMRLANLLGQIAERLSIVTDAQRATIHYAANEVERALALWEKVGSTDHRDYKVAKARCASFPEKIQPLCELERHAEVVEECIKNPGALPAKLAGFAAKSHANQGLLDRAVEYAAQSYSPQVIQALLPQLRGNGKLLTQSVCAYLVAAAHSGELGLLSSYTTRSGLYVLGSDKALKDWAAREKATLDEIWLRVVARTQTLAQLPWDDRKAKLNQRPLAEFLRQTFLDGGAPRVVKERYQELGAAIELLGNRTDALTYYEWLMRHSGATPELIKLARERWVVCKERQAKHEQDRGDARQARKFKSEADEVRAVLKDNRILADYPDLGPFADLIEEFSVARQKPAEPVELKSPVKDVVVKEVPSMPKPDFEQQNNRPAASAPKLEFVIDGVTVQILRAQGKAILRKADDESTVSCRFSTRIVQGLDVDVIESSNPGRWLAKQWNVAFSFGESGSVRISFLNLGIEFEVLREELPAPPQA